MAQNEFCVTEIPGPHVMKKVLVELGYSKEQIKLIDSLKPMQFPLYVYQNPDTRYWFGSNPAMMSGKAITWRSYLASMGRDEGLIADALETDLLWCLGKFKMLGFKVREWIGE